MNLGFSFYRDWKVSKTLVFLSLHLRPLLYDLYLKTYSVTGLLLIHNAYEDTESLQLSEDVRAA